MPNRDILWVLPDGRVTVVTVDDDGNPVEPIADTVIVPTPPVAFKVGDVADIDIDMVDDPPPKRRGRPPKR